MNLNPGGDFAKLREALTPLLPAHLAISHIYNGWSIQPKPNDMARRLLKVATGRDVDWGHFPRDISNRPELMPQLAHLPQREEWEDLPKADNPAAYLSSVMVKRIARYDENIRAHPEYLEYSGDEGAEEATPAEPEAQGAEPEEPEPDDVCEEVLAAL